MSRTAWRRGQPSLPLIADADDVERFPAAGAPVRFRFPAVADAEKIAYDRYDMGDDLDRPLPVTVFTPDACFQPAHVITRSG